MTDVDITRLKDVEHTQVILYSAYAKLSVSHVFFWMEVFESTGHPFSILVRSVKNYEDLTERYPQLQVCYAKAAVDVETVVKTHKNLKAVCYMTNVPKNIHILRFNYVKHIFIGTKNSDWLTHLNKSYRAYDEIWTGGEFVLERLKQAVTNLGSLQPKVVGKPQVKRVMQVGKASSRSHALILISSAYITENILSLELERSDVEGVHVYISPNKELFKEELVVRFRAFDRQKKISPFDSRDIIQNVFNDVSYIITDKKNLSPYMLLYGVPVIVYAKNSLESLHANPQEMVDAVYFWHNHQELRQILDTLSQGKDMLRQQREALCARIFNTEAVLNDTFFKMFSGLLK